MVSDKLKMLGMLAQKYPSWVRSVCRSHFQYDPPELLELLRVDTLDEMALNHLFDGYEFIKIHYYLLSVSRVEDVQNVLHARAMNWTCAYERSEHGFKSRKHLCCACPHVNGYIRERVKEVKDDGKIQCRAVV